MKNLLIFILLAILLVSCAPASTTAPVSLATNKPLPTATFTPLATTTFTLTPSNTPIPLVDLEGLLFFDYNGNGLKDGVEPAIVDFGVCTKKQEQKICVNSDAEGNFRFEKIAPLDSKILLQFVDPNTETPSLAFRYVNIWKGETVLPPYVYNNVNVPEQRLNDTVTTTLSEGVVVKVGEKAIIGLIQGIITLPLNADGLAALNKVMGFDHNPSKGVRDFTGSTNECYSPWDCTSKLATSQSPYLGTGDSHRGIDYGTFSNPTGIPFFAAHAGFISTYEGSNVVNGIRAICVNVSTDKNWSSGYSNGITTSYQHAGNLAVKDGDYVYRGQFLGFVGNTGTSWTHLHFEAWYGKEFKRTDEGYLYNKDFYAMIIPEFIISGFNNTSIWTVWNNPQESQISPLPVTYSPRPTATPLPISTTSITIDGNDNDWVGLSSVLIDESGDSLDGNSADLIEAYLITDESYLFIMVRAKDSFIRSKEAQMDVMLDLKSGSHCDGSEVGINVQQNSLPAYWDSKICNNAQNVKQISSASVKWGKVVEIRLPLQVLGDFEYIKMINVILNLHDNKWYSTDSMP